MLWIIGITSSPLLAISCLWYSDKEPKMDFQVYRMGGRRILGSGLYSSQIQVLGRHLSFTYPPLAALLFWPISHLPSLPVRFSGPPSTSPPLPP